MKRTAHTISILAIVGAVLASTSVTAIANTCDTALIKATLSTTSSIHDDWRLATLVTQENYEQVKHDAGASAVVYGVPLGAKYSDFKESLNNAMQSHNESRTIDEGRALAWTGLDPTSAKTYKDCLNAEVFNSNGLRAAVVAASDATVSVVVKWFVPTVTRPADVTWNPAKLGGNSLKSKISVGETTFTLQRADQDVLLVGNYQGFTTGPITIPAKLRPAAPPPPAIKATKSLIVISAGGGSVNGFVKFSAKDGGVLTLTGQGKIERASTPPAEILAYTWGPVDLQGNFRDGTKKSESIRLAPGSGSRSTPITGSTLVAPQTSGDPVYIGVRIDVCREDHNTGRREPQDTSICTMDTTVTIDPGN